MTTTDRTRRTGPRMIVMRPMHVVVENHMRERGWMHSSEVSIACAISVGRARSILRDLDLLGIVDARLAGGGFCQWRHRESEVG